MYHIVEDGVTYGAYCSEHAAQRDLKNHGPQARIVREF
jgi:hypothetical protein